MSTASRIRCADLNDRIMSAKEAAALIPNGVNVGMSGFTGAGYPKAIPQALADHIREQREQGTEYKIGVFTGASTAPELDGVLSEVNGMSFRIPYQSDPIGRKNINEGRMDYMDVHLSHLGPDVAAGFYGKLEVAVIEVVGITEDGHLIPSSSVGNNKTWIDVADKVILEVNHGQPAGLEGMHDIYQEDFQPPHRKPIPVLKADDRVGTPYIACPKEKIVAIVETNSTDRNSSFSEPDEASKQIAQNILQFFDDEINAGRMPKELLPIQSGVGNIANAVLAGLNDGPYKNLTSYTEVLQDGMLEMLKSGTLKMASCTSFSLSPDANQELAENIEEYKERIMLRQQEVSNHPEVIRRLGLIAMNGMIEADIYGNVNSTHIMGTRVMNGIGGSGDFARNGYLSIFMTPSVAKGGAISTIVPMVSHVDHTEHDVQVIVTEQGLADLRGLCPRKRALEVINKCAHPDYRDRLLDYYERATKNGRGQHTPHNLAEALSWHENFEETGKM